MSGWRSSTNRGSKTLFWVCLVLGIFYASYVGAEEIPEIDRPLVDEVGVVSDVQTYVIEEKLRAHHEATGVQMAVLIVESTGGYSIDGFSMRVAEKWEGGSAERDDGVLLTLAVGHRANRLELGYGLEALISDAQAGQILDEQDSADHIQKIITSLNKRERYIIIKRFGLDGEPELTLDEISQKIGVTRERVRQIQNKAFYKMGKQISL